MLKALVPASLCALCLGLAATDASADEVAESMVDDALPVMWHSCESLEAVAEGDEEVIIDVLRKIATVSIYAREIDIEAMNLSDEEVETAKERFYAAISDGCKADRKALLAGIVDDAVVAALEM